MSLATLIYHTIAPSHKTPDTDHNNFPYKDNLILVTFISASLTTMLIALLPVILAIKRNQVMNSLHKIVHLIIFMECSPKCLKVKNMFYSDVTTRTI